MAKLIQIQDEHWTQASTWECSACSANFLMDFAPDYCPTCGEEFEPQIDRSQIKEPKK